MLDGPRHARREVELGRHGLARLADLGGVGVPAGVDHRARRGHRTAQRPGQRLALLEALGPAQPAPARHEHGGVLDVHVGPAPLPAGDHPGPGRPGRELDLDVLHRRGPGALVGGGEGVEAPDDDPRLACVARVDEGGVAQDRAHGHEPAVLGAHLGDLHRDPGAHAGGEAGADLEAEQPAAEQRPAVAVRAHELGHRVHHRAGEALRRPHAEDPRGAVGAECGAPVVGEVVAAHHHDSRLALDRAARRAASETAPSEFVLNVPSLWRA